MTTNIQIKQKSTRAADKKLPTHDKTKAPNGGAKSVKGSFYDKNKHLIGSLSSNVTDLSGNKAHMKNFGRSKNADNR